MPNAREIFTHLREEFAPDYDAKDAAAKAIISELQAAARFAKCETATNSEGWLKISLPIQNAVVWVHVTDGQILLKTDGSHEPVEGLDYDAVSRQFAPASVDTVAQAVASKLREYLPRRG